MKTVIISIIFCAATFISFGLNAKPIQGNLPQTDTLAINPGDSTEYEILIIETGFENWMATNAKPRWFYSNEYLRNKNQLYVIDWNNRALQTMHKPPFEYHIDYKPTIDYGLEVNYQLYWYFKFIENKYKIRLGGSSKGR